LKLGKVTKMLGTLSMPNVIVSKMVATWDLIPNATSYVVIISNEYGPLITETITTNKVDFSIITTAGIYTINVTAVAPGYFNSDSCIVLYQVLGFYNDPVIPEPTTVSWYVIVLPIMFVLILAISNVFIFLVEKKKKTTI